MEIKPFFQSQAFKWTIFAILSLILLLMVFQAGIFVGSRKADFSYRFGQNYGMMLGGPRGSMMRDFGARDFIQGHGTVGSIIKIDANSLIIKSPEGVEKTINITGQTTIRQGRQDIKLSDLKLNDNIVVIGGPKNDGTIDAELIRIFDPALQPQAGILPAPPIPSNNLPPRN